MAVTELFEGIFKIEGKIATRNLVPGYKVYDEELKSIQGTEYRMWNPYRSKLGAALLNGLRTPAIKAGSNVLYLGAATGTTSSHVSDIVGMEGGVFCIEVSKRSMRDLLNVCERRENMFPIFADARNPDEYSDDVGEVDVLYQDVSAPDQADILMRNGALLKPGGIAYVAIKSQSIDVSRKPDEVFKEFISDVAGMFESVQQIKLEPFDKMHLFVVFRKTPEKG